MAKKILVVDDEPNIVALIASRLKQANYEVIEAYNAEQATTKALQEHPDLLILDIKMPAGTGISIIKKLKKVDDKFSTPIIFITGHEEMELMVKDIGMVDFIAKPFKGEDILAKVRKALGEVDQEKKGYHLNKKILVIDDEPHLVKLIESRLKATGYNVITSGDGKEGLEKAKQEKPDLIILDLMLPSLDGYTICQMLKTDDKYKNIPIIMLTARSQKSDETQGFKIGADSYITKPFKHEDLLNAVKTLIK